MIEDVLLSDIDCVSNCGLGNYMFKTITRSYTLNVPKKTLLRFIKKEGGLGMTEDWFDKTIVLNYEEFNKLKQKLCI